MKLIAVLVFACVAAFADPVIVEWSLSPGRTACFAKRPVGQDVRLVGLEWAEFAKKHEYCYVKRWCGWSKIKTSKMDNAGWDIPHGGNIQWPLHTPPYRRSLGGLVIVTPTISGDAHKK